VKWFQSLLFTQKPTSSPLYSLRAKL
jgi:hypothetical protein